MVPRAYKRAGIKPFATRLMSGTALVPKLKLLSLLPLLLLPLSLASCATLSTGTASSAQLTKQAVCGPWRPITYSGTKDTPETVRQVQVHDQAGKNLGCW